MGISLNRRSGGGGGGATSFVALTDTPAAITRDRFVKSADDADRLEYAQAAPGSYSAGTGIEIDSSNAISTDDDHIESVIAGAGPMSWGGQVSIDHVEIGDIDSGSNARWALDASGSNNHLQFEDLSDRDQLYIESLAIGGEGRILRGRTPARDCNRCRCVELGQQPFPHHFHLDRHTRHLDKLYPSFHAAAPGTRNAPRRRR